MRVENIRLKVGGLIAFTVLCAVAFVYLFQLAGGRLRLDEPYNAKALVPDAFNIVLNSDVRRDGVTIGRVRGIEPKGSMGEVKFEIEKEGQQQLYRDATVRVRTKTLVGESYLDVEPGTPQAGRLPTGSVLPLEATQEAVPLERILETMDAETRRSVRANLRGLGGALDGRGAELNRTFGALRPTVASGGRLVRALKPQRAALADLIGNTGEVLAALGERESAFRSLVVDARTTADAVASRDAKLRETFAELPDTLRQAQRSVGVLAGFSGRATPTVRDLRVASVDLAPAVRDLEPAARDARSLFRELGPFLDRIDPLLDRLSPAARQLRAVVGPLDSVLRQANPALRYLEPYAKEFGTFFANTGSFLDTKDAVGNKGRVFAVAGTNSYANLTKEQRDILDALVRLGTFSGLGNTGLNSYPPPGLKGVMGTPEDGSYTNVEPDK
jgi:phospholipid/cholesterol/gamma-HCH transport system substrate-binding protein